MKIVSWRKAIRSCPFWCKALLISFLIPTEMSFSIADLRLSAYRVVLILAFIPSWNRLTSNKSVRISLFDVFILFHLLWCFVVIGFHHGLAVSIESGGIRALEFGGAYLVARAWVIDEKAFRSTTVAIFILTSIIMPFAVFEMVTGVSVFKEVAAALTGGGFYNDMGQRMGLTRAFVTFDHPILLGVFGASSLGIAWYRAIPRMGGLPRKRKLPMFAAVITGISSLSSGAVAAIVAQLTLVFWRHKTRNNPSRWKLFILLLVVVYITVDLLSNRSGIRVFLHYLTFSPATAYYRTIIFDFGIAEVWRHPFMGIGFNDWMRPSWMFSSSIDNFWLVQAMTFGAIGFITMFIPFMLILSRGWKKNSVRVARLRFGWTVSLIGFAIAGCTVHFWNSLFVYFSFFLGLGAWFQHPKLNRYIKNGFR